MNRGEFVQSLNGGSLPILFGKEAVDTPLRFNTMYSIRCLGDVRRPVNPPLAVRGPNIKRENPSWLSRCTLMRLCEFN
jgi:hypothetical protein